MKALCFAFTVFLLMAACSAPVNSSLQLLPKAEISEEHFVPRKPAGYYTPNGIHVYAAEDHELPLVYGTLYIPNGSLWAKEDEVGVIPAMGAMLRNGGAGSLSAVELDRELEKLAASIASSFGAEFGTISFSCLSGDLDRVFELFSDVILRPRFERERLELLRLSALDGIKRRRDNPVEVANIAFKKLLFGDSPYGRTVRSSDVERITRDSIIKSYREMVAPDGSVMAIAGDISMEKLQALMRKHFDDWRPKSAKPQEPPPAPEEGLAGIYFVRLPFQQATVFMGEVGIPRFTPDWHSILVFNEMFGEGGFGSRLMRTVRSDEGLAYSINGGIMPSGGRGVNSIAFQTKANSAGSAIAASLGVLADFKEGRFKRSEVNETKDALLNSFVFKFDTSNDIVQRKAGQEVLRFPDDYDATYVEQIKSVTPQNVREVAQNRWHPGAFTIVVVGDEKAAASISSLLKGPLSGYKFIEVSFDETLIGP